MCAIAVWLSREEAVAALPAVAPGGRFNTDAFGAWLGTQVHFMGPTGTSGHAPATEQAGGIETKERGWLQPHAGSFVGGPEPFLRPLRNAQVALRKLAAFEHVLGAKLASTSRSTGQRSQEHTHRMHVTVRGDVNPATAPFTARLQVVQFPAAVSCGSAAGAVAGGGAAGTRDGGGAADAAAAIAAPNVNPSKPSDADTVVQVTFAIEGHVADADVARTIGNLNALLQAACEYAGAARCGASFNDIGTD